jgi:integrase
MPKAKGYPIKVIRVSRDMMMVPCIRWNGQIVRNKLVTMDAFMAFLTGKIDKDSNLPPDAVPIMLADFTEKHYLPEVRTRLKKRRTIRTEGTYIKSLCKTLGSIPLHEINPSHAAAHKKARREDGARSSTIKHELQCLRRVAKYGVEENWIKQNLLLPVLGLPDSDRSWLWLKLAEIDRLIEACDPYIKFYVEFLVLTGARCGDEEGLDFRAKDVQIEKGLIWLPTQKKRKKLCARQFMRPLQIHSLGPRFAALLAKLTPDPESGRFFPFSYTTFNKLFVEARNRAGFGKIPIPGTDEQTKLHAHDLRGTFAMHRVMVDVKVYDLQRELGHGDLHSLQKYVDQGQMLDPKESIFYALEKPKAVMLPTGKVDIVLLPPDQTMLQSAHDKSGSGEGIASAS